MSKLGFWPGGRDNHERAYEQLIRELQEKLRACNPTDREQLGIEIEEAKKALRDGQNPTVLW